MKRAAVVTIAASSLLAGLLTAAVPASAAPPSNPEDRLDVYAGEILRSQVGDIVDLGVDRHEIELEAVDGPDGDPSKGDVRVETILSADQAEQLAEGGVELELKEVEGGESVAQRATTQAAEGYEVFQMYSGPGGLQEEIQQAAADNPDIAKLVTIGQSTNGQDIQAVKVTRNAQSRPDGSRPATLYMSAQHAREWITPEMTTRLLAYVLENYESDREIRRLVNQTELWFLPVANPDGYDFTFEPGQRLWRKNLRDNNGDGVIAPGDGVDLNRNFPTRWGYDNEGSSPNPASEVYRGPSPGSEPETQVLDAFVGEVGFEFLVNYHSAAELLLYGLGWQVSTPSPDDVLYEAMVGDDANPAVAGYDPDISAELYITNGDTDTHMQAAWGTLGFTPEMATCESASDSVPDDEWEAEDCGSGFQFPDDEDLVQAEFEKNIPFAIATGQSALDPDDPVSVVGRTAADLTIDPFEVSYGDDQTVAVTAKRALRNVRLNYSIDGVRQRTQAVEEWDGGERYGFENTDYYAEYRAEIRGTEPGDSVEVWFTGTKPGAGRTESERFTYTVESDSGADVLVIANEDYTGVNPDYPDSVTAPKYAAAHVAAVEAAGYTADVWDVDAQGVPHPLGVLDHYDAVVWYTGDDRLAQDPEDELTDTPFGPLPDISVKEQQQYLTLSVRDYLNEGGKLVNAGETAQYQGLSGISDSVGGLYYGLNGDPTAECVIDPEGTTAGFFEDCLILADDFRQYWLGAYTRTDVSDPTQVDGVADPLTGLTAQLGGPVVEGDNPLDEAGTFQPTSDVLPVEEFPQFASEGAALYPLGEGSPFAPIEGTRYAGALHADSSYMRLTQTVDLTGATSGELAFQLSANTEPAYDFVIVEARTAGGTDWTTLSEVGGLSSTTPPAECADDGFLLALHPFLASYLGGADCTQPGTSGTWNGVTGGTGGWQDVAYDLSDFAGSPVEVSISYVTDPATGGVGAFVDDTRITVDGVVTADGFEDETTAWTVGGPPPGSPPNGSNWAIGEVLFTLYAATSTEDTLLLGFGLEQVATDEERAALVRAALDGLLATP